MIHIYYASEVRDEGIILALCSCQEWRSFETFIAPDRGVNEAVARNTLRRYHDEHLRTSTKLATERSKQ